MRLSYPNLRYHAGQFLYNTEREMIRTHGPRVTENVVQALARLVITDQMLEIQALPEVDIVLQVHDEIIAIGSEHNADATMNKIIEIMRTAPNGVTIYRSTQKEGVSQVYDK